MKYTSAAANKLLKQLQGEYSDLVYNERLSCVFVAATVENLEEARPEYSYEALQERLEELDRQIRTIKHAINVFNTTTTVDGFGMTIDQMLVYIPQLSAMKDRLSGLTKVLPKRRLDNTTGTSLVEYQYANYDVARAKADYDRVCKTLNQAQLALDRLNTTETMEIEL